MRAVRDEAKEKENRDGERGGLNKLCNFSVLAVAFKIKLALKNPVPSQLFFFSLSLSNPTPPPLSYSGAARV